MTVENQPVALSSIPVRLDRKVFGKEWRLTFRLGDMAEDRVELDALEARAKKHEMEYDWASASADYGEILERGLVDDPLHQGEYQEAGAYALLRHAFQAEDSERFRDGMAKAASKYSEAISLYGKPKDSAADPYLRRCESALSYIGCWQASAVAEKKRLVNESWALTRQALMAFEEANDDHNYWMTFIRMSLSANLAISYCDEDKAVLEILEPAMESGERTIELLSALPKSDELALAYIRTFWLLDLYSVYCEWKDAARYDKKASNYSKKAHEISEKAVFTDVSGFLMGGSTSTEQEQTLHKKLEFAEKARDALLKCEVYSRLAAVWNWSNTTAKDPEENERNFDQALEYSLASQREAAKMSFMVPLVDGELWTAAPYAGLYGIRAYFGFEFLRVREFAEKAEEASSDAIDLAEASGYAAVIEEAHHQHAYNLTTLAMTELDIERKEKLLQQALKHRELCLARRKRLFPRGGWGLGVYLNLLAETESELASLTEDAKAKIELLGKAAEHGKVGLDQNLKFMAVFGQSHSWQLRLLGLWFSAHGRTLERLFEADGDRGHMISAAETYDRAAKLYVDSRQPSRAAEAYWKAASTYESLEDWVKSSDRFGQAANLYRQAARDIPRLEELYKDYSKYMQAWMEIELARTVSTRRDAEASRESYERASRLLESTGRWKHLAPYFLAAAEEQKGMSFSQKGKSAEASASFGKALDLFADAEDVLNRQVNETEEGEDRATLSDLIGRTSILREWCRGWMMLERAKTLDNEGDEFGSCEKYSQAAEVFEEMESRVIYDWDRKEMKLAATLAKAWHKMTRAEAEGSPGLYEEASGLFEQAKVLSTTERDKLLASGNSLFCRAVQAGMKFAESGDPSHHGRAIEDLERAAKHYLKAGLVKEAEYAKASKLLFDAYAYMDKAIREEDNARKTKLYIMTEKVLEASAKSYSNAGYPKKKSQVTRLSEKVKGERELALTLTEVLRAPDPTSSISAFGTAPPRDTAAGPRKFERARIEATIVAQPMNVRVGEEVRLEIDMVNAGAGVAQLIRVENVIPPSFDLVSRPDRWRVEESDIDLKGRRLDPLATETVPVVMKPLSKGNFSFTPRVLYLDEFGEHKSTRSKHITLTVKELGVAGWLKGPERRE